jgi:hypothetical protein
VKGLDGVTEIKDYLDDVSENAYAEDITLKMLVNCKAIDYNCVYEVELLNGVIQGYYGTDMKKTDIKYSDEEDMKNKIKNRKPVFEFLYNSFAVCSVSSMIRS